MNRTNNESVLATLRSLVPARPLTYAESLRIAELQANRLLELLDIEGPRVPSEVVTELPRLEVRWSDDMPVSGSSHWENGRWIITLNVAEPVVRQRFSLMHEFKHIIDHTSKAWLYGDTQLDSVAFEHAERAADQFAACLLMPKRWIKSAWFRSGQNPTRLANELSVSTQALSVRLWRLGLAPPTPRCPSPSTRYDEFSARTMYFRYTPLAGVAA